MPFPFILPTTSFIRFSEFFSSTTHPSLPITLTTRRAVVRDALKKHKRLPPSSQASNLSNVLSSINEYLPYLFMADVGLSGSKISGEEVDVVLVKELEVEWRATLSSTVGGREPPRVRVRSLESEIAFILSTLALANSMLARTQMHTLYNGTVLDGAQRTAAITSAMRYYLEANSIHSYLAARAGQWTTPPATADISQALQSALASLTMAEATLITVLKDDPYPSVVADDRNENVKDWMFKSPEIPKVRAHLFARLCLAAAGHAAQARALFGSSGKVDEDLLAYSDDLRRTARGKACRFLGIDAELAERTGEGIAWLRGAKAELGFGASTSEDDGKLKGFSRFRKDWAEKREDKKIKRGVDWGTDAGRFEEARIVDKLEKKWAKMNDTVNVQVIPPYDPLLSTIPSGREYHTPKPFKAPNPEEDIVFRMRAPPGHHDDTKQGESDSDDEEHPAPPGAFLGSQATSTSANVYY
ncbi:pH-response regulator protein palC [Eremomyces bilateralis CBS 781.70]|uniref:pH-response regulator protein palC n=1 Tax=Eremomyces bilateralis CBS 781.70 TaxID=1392243 RepID=A0A6G1G2Z7_9PEZI|nr:pH-response regulator protein palC [Eremomyces bilateralis CBS 781.70]KAF1812362.1 pH-response regulator protein palC [Eremomyces bilateralis CBS 781.70]